MAGAKIIHARTDSWEVVVTIATLKVEYVGEALRRLEAASESLHEEGLDVQFSCSVERNRDGVEHWHEWVADDGSIKDINPWGEI